MCKIKTRLLSIDYVYSLCDKIHNIVMTDNVKLSIQFSINNIFADIMRK